MKPAQKSDLNITLPMPALHATVALDRVFSKDETALLKLGYVPHEMQDKWFIYFENDVLYFHRSWTGFCTFQISFIPEGDGLRMTGALVSRDPDQYKGTRAERDRELISELIDRLLLDRDGPSVLPGA